MKGLASVVGVVATVLALGYHTEANGESLGQELFDYVQHSGFERVGPSAPDTLAVDATASRHLQPMGGGPSSGLDDALDVNGSVSVYIYTLAAGQSERTAAQFQCAMSVSLQFRRTLTADRR